MIRLQPDQRVARAAWRFPSESRPGAHYDVALLLDETRRDGLAWSCECWVFLERDRCKHVDRAREAWRAEQNARRS